MPLRRMWWDIVAGWWPLLQKLLFESKRQIDETVKHTFPLHNLLLIVFINIHNTPVYHKLWSISNAAQYTAVNTQVSMMWWKWAYRYKNKCVKYDEDHPIVTSGILVSITNGCYYLGCKENSICIWIEKIRTFYHFQMLEALKLPLNLFTEPPERASRDHA